MSSIPSNNRGQWGSSFGFIMAAAGSAVGIGNIWRFPYVVGENGGGAFVFIYVLAVMLIGIPLLFVEMGLGRFSNKGAFGAFKSTGASPFWLGAGGILALLVSFFVLSYYGVVAGWTIGYIFKMISGSHGEFDAFAANPYYVPLLLLVFTLLTIAIISGGVSGGIEKAAKILMPLLLVLLCVVAIRSLTLEGAMEGVKFYLYPDFSKITANSVLAALGQAFFSMSIGWGIMITYGSYLPKDTNMVSSGVWVGVMDTAVALLAGFIIFPAVFAFGKEPAAGPTLVFKVLPDIFSSIPGGALIGALFFLLLTIAALTSSISMLEVPAAYFIDEKKWGRKKSAWFVGAMVFIMGIPSALSYGGNAFLTNVTFKLPWEEKPLEGFQNIVDYVFGTFFIVVVALATCCYAAWKMPVKNIVGELSKGSPLFNRGNFVANLFIFFIRFVCPIVILGVLLNMMGVFGVFSGA